MSDEPQVPEVMPDLSALLGGESGGLSGLFEQASKMAEAHAAAADAVIEGVAGGGAVRIEVTGHGEFLRVTIDPAAVDPNDVDMLQDLVLAALHDATAQVADLQQQAMGSMSLDLLGDMFASPAEDEEDDDDDEDRPELEA
jgi:DNA-binding YbaB/EbfC family protein